MAGERQPQPLTLSSAHVAEVDRALAAIFAASAYGEVTLRVSKDRIDEIGVNWSVKFSDDVLPETAKELWERAIDQLRQEGEVGSAHRSRAKGRRR